MIRFRGKRKRINIPQEIGVRYQKVGILLLEDETGARIEAIADQHRGNAERINMDVFQKWINGNGKQPITWGTLVEVLKDAEFNSLASDIEEVKTSPHTSPYTQQ